MNNEYSYRNLNVYKKARSLVIDIYELLKMFPAEERFALCDQIRRAAISITSNIAEGMSRYSSKEKVHFIEIAYASMMEVESQFDIACALTYISENQFEEISLKIRDVAKMLSGLLSTYIEK